MNGHTNTRPDGDKKPLPEVRPARDASDDARLRRDPSHEDAKLDVAIDETFPASDPPANTRPGTDDPAPSSGYDEEEERKRAKDKS